LAPRLGSDITYAQLIERAASVHREQDGAPLWSVGFRDGWGQIQPHAPLDDSAPGWVELAFRLPDSWADTDAIDLPAGPAEVKDVAVPADQILIQAGHHSRGVFLAWGSGLRRGEIIGEVAQLDVLPTLLALLSLPGALDLRGRAADVLPPEDLAALPAPVKTYENPIWERLSLPREKERDLARRALLEQLRSRGYVN
jgi:hypothetical protein